MFLAGAVGLVTAVVLGGTFAGEATGSRLDRWVAAAVELPPGLAPVRYPISVMVQGLADPLPAAALILALALICLWRRRPRFAALAIVAPAVTDVCVITAKHVVGRTIHGGSLSYPSTHAAHSVAVTMVAMLLVASLVHTGPRVSTALVLGGAGAAATGMGWALVGGSVHYLTDVVGGLGVALAVLPPVVYGIDLISNRLAADRRVGTPR